jgi:periplasmic protein TonB
VTGPPAEEGTLQRQWAPALWASLCLHLILVGALQPAPAPSESRFSERAIEITVERATPPPAPPAAMTRAEPADSAPSAVKADTPIVPLPEPVEPLKLVQAVTLSQPTPAVDSRELALAAPATAPRSPEHVAIHLPQQKAIKPPAPAPATSASQHPALQDYVLQVVRKLSHTRFYAASPAAQDVHGVVIARLTVARDGGLIDLSLPKQSGLPGVDGSVLDAIRRAAPFAPLPKDFTDNRFTFIVPINYTPER